MGLCITDAHCHLDFPVFDAERALLLDQARALGVKRFILPATQAIYWPRLLDLAQQHQDCWVCLGLHPYWMATHQQSDLQALDQLIQAQKSRTPATRLVAIGEIGIDLSTPALQAQEARQWSFLDAQLALAKRYDLPVVLHVRQALDRVIQRLRRAALPRAGLIHAFSGSVQQAQQLVDLGFSLGLGGALTYPRAQKLRRVATTLPASAFLLETDSPDMPLCGFQGQINTPAQLVRVLDCWATLRSEPASVLAALVEQKVDQLFFD